MGTTHALDGVKVLDFSWMYAGPHATKHLAALGADVVKVESQVKPDPMRHGFTYDQFDSSENPNVSAYYNEFNLGKKSLRLNLTETEGREIVLELAKEADVWIENFSPQFLEKLDLDYETVTKVNGDLVYVSMPGWAKSGPARNYKAWGMNLESMAGLDHISGFPDDPPTPAGFSWPDPTAGMVAVISICMALLDRENSGEGTYIEVPQFEATVSLLHNEIMQYNIEGEISERIGNRDADERFVQGAYECHGTDRWVAIAIESDEHWKSFCAVAGVPELSTDDRFDTHSARLRNHHEVDEIIQCWTRNQSAEEAKALLQQNGVPAGIVADEHDLMENSPQLRDREFFSQFDHPDVGEQRYPGIPFKINDNDVDFPSRSPQFGEHTEKIMKDWINADEGEIDRLKDEEILY